MRGAWSGLAAVLLWGLAPVTLKSLAPALPGLLASTAIYAVATVATLPWLWAARRHARAPWQTWLQVVAIGVMLTSAFTLLVSLAAPGVRGTTIGAIVALEPLMVALISAGLARRWPGRTTLGALALSLAGAWLLIAPAGHGAGGGAADAPWAIALVLLGAGLWSTAVVLATRLQTPWPPLQASMVMICCGSLPFVAVAPLLLPAWTDARWSAGIAGGVLFMALGATVLANALWLRALRAIGPVATTLLINLVPLTTVSLSVLWLGEPWGLRQLGGAALVLLGLSLGPLLRAWQRPHPPSPTLPRP